MLCAQFRHMPLTFPSFPASHCPEGFQWDYIFDWTILKHQQTQGMGGVPRPLSSSRPSGAVDSGAGPSAPYDEPLDMAGPSGSGAANPNSSWNRVIAPQAGAVPQDASRRRLLGAGPRESTPPQQGGGRY